MEQADQVAVIMVPTPAQGHLNQLMQLSCLISSYPNIAVYFVGSAVHNRQARVRANGLDPLGLAKINFHDLPAQPFASPPPDPASSNKFPTQLRPAWEATLSLREPAASFLRETSDRFKRIVVIHDFLMSFVVQDVASVLHAESYAFNCASAFSLASYIYDALGNSVRPREMPIFEETISEELGYFTGVQMEPFGYRAGDIYDTCRLVEPHYMDFLEKYNGNRKSWAIGPILPATLSLHNKHECLDWLDKQEPNSVIYVSFGTTTSLSDEQIKELALGLEQSKVKFIWVLRDADKGDVFDGEVRRAELPARFEERTRDVGMIVRDWAPQPQILAHKSTGGFMSHCGWNSCLESMTMGVPIAAWPMHSDQPSNSVLITEVLKMGVLVRGWGERKEVVKASRIENVLKRLMLSEEGDEIRKRAGDLRDTVPRATEEGGASRLELDSFITHITR